MIGKYQNWGKQWIRALPPLQSALSQQATRPNLNKTAANQYGIGLSASWHQISQLFGETRNCSGDEIKSGFGEDKITSPKKEIQYYMENDRLLSCVQRRALPFSHKIWRRLKHLWFQAVVKSWGSFMSVFFFALQPQRGAELRLIRV